MKLRDAEKLTLRLSQTVKFVHISRKTSNKADYRRTNTHYSSSPWFIRNMTSFWTLAQQHLLIQLWETGRFSKGFDLFFYPYLKDPVIWWPSKKTISTAVQNLFAVTTNDIFQKLNLFLVDYQPCAIYFKTVEFL